MRQNTIVHTASEMWIQNHKSKNLRLSMGKKLVRTSAVIDNVSFRGTHLRMIYADRSSYVIRDSFFPDMFADGDPTVMDKDVPFRRNRREGL